MEKQFINENQYQKTRKGLIIAAVSVIIITLAVSGIFCLAPGFSKLNEANNFVIPSDQEIKAEQDANDAKNTKAEADLDSKYEVLTAPIQAQITSLERQGQLTHATGAEYYALEDQRVSLRAQLNGIDKQKSNESSALFRSKTQSSSISKDSYESKKRDIQVKASPYIAIGFFVIFFGVFMVGGSLFYAAFARNFVAFGAQTAVPVGKEVIEDVAPIIGKAYGEAAKAAAHGLSAASKDMGPAFGTIAKEVSKGIKEGFKEDKPKTKE